MSQKTGYFALLIAFIAFGAFLLFLNRNTIVSAAHCPCNVFSGTPSSYGTYKNDDPIELGMQFIAAYNGYVTGVRFYKDASMGGVHTGELWDRYGNLLATATFTNETVSGWQDVVFSSPVSVLANQRYTVSMNPRDGNYIATGGYFNSAISTEFLTAPRSGSLDSNGNGQSNGVYSPGTVVAPTSSYNATNYWVDVNYVPGTVGAPTVMSVTPSNAATNAGPRSRVSATFSGMVDPSTISSLTITLLDSQGQAIDGAVNYDGDTMSASFVPSSPLVVGHTYTAWVRGGDGGVKNYSNQSLVADYHWSFTVNADNCPCSILGDSPQLDAGSMLEDNPSGSVVLGQAVVSSEDGYIQAIRFYAQSLQTISPTHQVGIWSSSGVLLGSATSSHESQGGWQEVTLSSPVPIVTGQQYIIAYIAGGNEHYAYTQNGLAGGKGGGILRVVSGGGRYSYNSSLVFPSSISTTNYWLDAIFTPELAFTPPLTVQSWQPTDNSYGVKAGEPLTVTFNRALDPSTVAGGVSVIDDVGHTVAGTATYNDLLHRISFAPTSPLSSGVHYKFALSTAIRSLTGQALSGGQAVGFTTGVPATTTLDDGKGGPILVLTDSNNYDTYLAEILRTEGMNHFTLKPAGQLSASLLASYRVVLLGETTLTSSQVSAVTAWVNGGGSLVGFRPHANLSSLFGLMNQPGALSDEYLKIDTSTQPGMGLVSDTVQYHTVADRYTTLTGTQTVATLYQDEATSANAPAITMRKVGQGYASAFAYNLAQSIALTHQGNPALAGTSAAGSDGAVRPDSLFHTGATASSSDWLNVSKAAIPQADEQQRLLSNLIIYTSSQATGALPRYWYLPNGDKGALIMQMDDHGTPDASMFLFQNLALQDKYGCLVTAWECARGGAFLFPSSGITDTQALIAEQLGFSVGVHHTVSTAFSVSCTSYTSESQLSTYYDQEKAAFEASYPGLKLQQASRTHCYAWSDWDSLLKVDVAHGIHFNMNYEWYPNDWTGANTGYLTGSGMTMRFTDRNGRLIDDFQGVTDLDYENDTTTATMHADMSGIVNDNYYSVLGTHIDSPSNHDNYIRNLMASARSYGLPLISAEQMVTWKQAQSASTFDNVSSTPHRLTFSPRVAEGGVGMMAMVPATTSNGTLNSLTNNGSQVAYTTETVNGIVYAIFSAMPGAYVALYGNEPVAPHQELPPSLSNTVTESSPFSDITSLAVSKPNRRVSTPGLVTSGASPKVPTDSTRSIESGNNHSTKVTPPAPLESSEEPAGATKTKVREVPVGTAIVTGSAVVAAGGGWWLLAARRRRKDDNTSP